jgi:DNA-binding NtrC family response regulator
LPERRGRHAEPVAIAERSHRLASSCDRRARRSRAVYRWFVTESLQGRDIDVVPCRSLDEATAVHYSQGAADLLLVDSQVIRGRDVETLRALSQQGASMRCVVLDSDGDRGHCRGGAVTCADKPVDKDAVVRPITAHLGAHRPAA